LKSQRSGAALRPEPVRADAVAEHWHLWSFHAGTRSIGALACRERLALEGFRVA